MVKFYKSFFVCVLVVICSFAMVACGTQGQQGIQGEQGVQGERGLKGEDGATIISDYKEYLNYLWTENLNDVQSKYSTYETFLVQYPQDYIRGEQGEQGVPGDGSVQNAANLALQSAVCVSALVEDGTYRYGQSGSGVIYKLFSATNESEDEYSGDGYIITNYHVVSRYFDDEGLVLASAVRVSLYGMPQATVSSPRVGIPATIVGGSAEYDIAVLEIIGTQSFYNDEKITTVCDYINSATVRPVNDSVLLKNSSGFRDVTVGAQVFAIGNPLNQGIRVSEGIISTQSEYLEMTRLDYERDYFGNLLMQDFRVIGTTAAINPGNSGGGLFDANGDLVGIVQARWFWTDDEDPVDNMGYAIPLDVALRVVSQVISRYEGGESKPVLCQKAQYAFDVSGRNAKVTYNEQSKTLAISETVYVSRIYTDIAGALQLPIDTVIESITINHVKYLVTRAYQIEEFMIEAYGLSSDKIKFNET